MIEVGERAPSGVVWLGPRESVQLDDIWADGELTLIVFYLFDWSST